MLTNPSRWFTSLRSISWLYIEFKWTVVYLRVYTIAYVYATKNNKYSTIRYVSAGPTCLILSSVSIRWIIKLQIQDSIIPIMKSLRLAIYVLYFSDGTKTYIYILCHSSTWTWHRHLESFLLKGQDLPISHSQSRGCWWPGDARSQGINSHDNDPIKSRSLYPHTLEVKIAAIAILGFKHRVLYFAPCVGMSTYI